MAFETKGESGVPVVAVSEGICGNENIFETNIKI